MEPSIFFSYLDRVELDASLDDIDGGKGAVGDGAADTTGGGALEVVHEIVDLLRAGGGHDGLVVGVHGWRYKNKSEKVAFETETAHLRRQIQALNI